MMPFLPRLFGSSHVKIDMESTAFFDRLDGWKSALPLTNLRGFAIRTKDNALQLQVGNIDLMPQRRGTSRMISKTDISFGFNIFLPTEEATSLILECCTNGILRLPDENPITLFARRSKYQTDFHDHWSGLSSAFPRNLSLSIRLDEVPRIDHPGTAILDYALRSSEMPFSGYRDLFDKFALADPSGRPRLEICAHSPISIRQSESILNNGTISAEILAPDPINVGKVTVGFASFDTLADRGRLDLVERTGEYLKFAASGLAGRKYKLLANYDGVNVDEGVVIDPTCHPSPIASILGAFDPSLAVTKTYVDGQGKVGSRDFEAGVGTLFSLLGFNVLPLYTAQKLNDAPDMVITTSHFQFGVVECTLLDLNNKDKLSKLRRRTEQIRASLREHNLDSTIILPIIVSPLSRNELAADLAMAKENNICVIAKEELEHFFARASLHPLPEQVFSELMKSAES